MMVEGSPENVALAAAVVSKLQTDTKLTRAKAALWQCAGLGLLLVGLGAGIGLALWGWSYTHISQLAVSERSGDTVRPTAEQLQRDATPASKARIVTNFTIFKTAEFADGEVQTAWNFGDSNQEHPESQYCLFVRRPNDSPNTYVTIGTNGEMDLPKFGMPGVDLKAAYANCVWSATDAPGNATQKDRLL